MMFPSKVYASAILVITSASSPTNTVENGEKLQMYARYGSSAAVVNSWFITNKGAEETHTGTATIDEVTGELTATGVGTVTVGATQTSPFATSTVSTLKLWIKSLQFDSCRISCELPVNAFLS